MIKFMEPIAGAQLAGQAASSYLRRSRVTVAVNEDYDTFSECASDSGVRGFFFPVKSPAELTPLHGDSESLVYSKPFEWVVANRGYALGSTAFEFAVQSVNATVALLGGKPIVYPGFEGTRGIAVLPPPVGGPTTGNFLSVSLDSGTIDCRAGDNPGAPSIPFRYDIRTGETDIFRVYASSSKPCVWFLRLIFVVNGKKVEFDVRRENGEDFVTLPGDYSGITASYEWTSGRWKQVRC